MNQNNNRHRPVKEWEEELAPLLYDFKEKGEPYHEKIYEFIHQTLSSERQKLLSAIEGLKREEVPANEIERLKNANHFEQKIEMYKMGYNAGLSTLKEKLGLTDKE
jgi:hypothetical protein